MKINKQEYVTQFKYVSRQVVIQWLLFDKLLWCFMIQHLSLSLLLFIEYYKFIKLFWNTNNSFIFSITFDIRLTNILYFWKSIFNTQLLKLHSEYIISPKHYILTEYMKEIIKVYLPLKWHFQDRSFEMINSR